MGFGIRLRAEELKGVEFLGLGRIKEKDLLRVSEKMDSIRRHRPMTTSFFLNKVDDEFGDFRSPDDETIDMGGGSLGMIWGRPITIAFMGAGIIAMACTICLRFWWAKGQGYLDDKDD